MKEELADEKVENATLKVELESALNKVKFIAIDAILHAWTELMENFKKGEHANLDPNQEIQTWKNREAMLAKGDKESEEKEDESTPMVESPRHVEPEIATTEKSTAEKEVGEVGPKEPVDPIAS